MGLCMEYYNNAYFKDIYPFVFFFYKNIKFSSFLVWENY